MGHVHRRGLRCEHTTCGPCLVTWAFWPRGERCVAHQPATLLAAWAIPPASVSRKPGVSPRQAPLPGTSPARRQCKERHNGTGQSTQISRQRIPTSSPRCLNGHKELAAHCMEDIDAQFKNSVRPGDVMAAGCCGTSGALRLQTRRHHKESGVACVIAKLCAHFHLQRHQHRPAIFECEAASGIAAGDEVRVVSTPASSPT